MNKDVSLAAENDFLQLACRIAGKRAGLLAGRFGFTKQDVPDIMQELLLEIYRQRENFVPDRGCAAVFILRIVNNKIVDLVRYRQADCRDWRKCRQSLNETVIISDVGAVELIDLLCADDNKNFALAVDVDMIRERLSAELQELCEYLLNYDLGETSGTATQSRGAFQYRMKKLRENFQKHGF
jgi:RNA polymerase sigma-70 factor (ECF subfamily)